MPTSQKSPEHDDDRPPPCPWCGQDRVRELTRPAADAAARYFTCAGCRRTFVIGIISDDKES